MKFMILLLLATLSASLMAEVGQVRDSSLTNFDIVIQPDPDEVVVNPDAMRRAVGGLANSGTNINRVQFQDYGVSDPIHMSLHTMNVRSAFASAVCPFVNRANAAANTTKIQNYCDYLSGNLSACPGNGSTPQQKCQVDCVIKEDHQQQIQADMSELSADQKKQACVDRVNNVISTSPVKNLDPNQVRGGLMVAQVSVLNGIKANMARRRARLEEGSGLGCSNAPQTYDCDNFANTAMENTSISTLASLFSTEYTTSRTGFLGLSAQKGCDQCMESKYEAARTLMSVESAGSYDQALASLKEQRVVELAARKANEAISNYLKFVERNDFMARFASDVQKESCETLPSLSSLPRSCRLSSKILEKIKSGYPNAQGRSAQASIQDILSKSKDAMFNRKSSCDGDYDFDVFQRSRLAQVGSGDLVTSLWIDSVAEQKIQSCQNHDTNCFVRAMAETYTSKIRNVSFEDARATLISHMSMSPFFRTMMASKVGVLAFKDMGMVSLNGVDSVDQFFERNKAKIWDAAKEDRQIACAAIDRDLKLALCSTADNLAENYTGEEIRTELATLINDSADARVRPGLYLNLGVSCSLLRDSEAHLSNTTPRALSMTAADRSVAAIPLSQQSVAGFETPIDVFSQIVNDTCAARAPDALSLFPNANGGSLIQMGAGNAVICNQTNNPYWIRVPNVPDCLSSPTFGSGGGSSYFGNNLGGIFSNLGNGFNGNTNYYGSNGSGSLSSFQFPTYDGMTDNQIVVTGTRSANTPSNQTTEKLTQDLSTQGSSNPGQTNTNGAGSLNDVTLSKSADGTYQTNEMVSTTAATTFASMSGAPNSLGQPVPQMRGMTSNFTNSFQPQVQMPQQIEVANTVAGATVRREEALVRQESELLRRIDSQGIENRELRDAVTQLRREMSTMASQNAQLLPTLQSMMKARGAKVEPVSEEEQEEESAPAVAEVVPTTTSPRARGRAPASVPSSRNLERSGGQAQGGSEGVARTQGPANLNGGQAGGVNIVQEARGPQVIGGAAGAGANVTVNTGGARAGGGMERLVTRFTPSSSVTRQALTAPGSAVAEVGAEEKTQLVMEFLDYVKDFPLYRNGAYLSQSNDTITVDYGGREVVVRLDQIPDPQTRSLVQERIITQRMNLNQQLRQARLTELRRLLAEASDGL